MIDATNPGGSTPEGREADRIGVAALTQSYFPEARLVRSFCAVDASCVEAGHGYGDSEPLAVPLAGDDKDAVDLVPGLVRDTGCVPVITGDADSARVFQRNHPGFRANTYERRLRQVMGL